MTPEIRAALAEGPLTMTELSDRLHLQDYASLDKLRRTVADLVSRGMVELEEQEPKYRLTGKDPAQIQRKIWRAVQIRGAATPKQVALLVECSRDYARRYLYWLAKQGWLLRDPGSAILRVNPEMAGGEPLHWARVREEKKTGDRGRGTGAKDGRR